LPAPLPTIAAGGGSLRRCGAGRRGAAGSGLTGGFACLSCTFASLHPRCPPVTRKIEQAADDGALRAGLDAPGRRCARGANNAASFACSDAQVSCW
jgi:hypothetical protein